VIAIPDNAEAWIELEDGSSISINSNTVLRISTWTPNGRCLETLCFRRPLAQARYINAPAQAGEQP
jgi:hypothetical protein